MPVACAVSVGDCIGSGADDESGLTALARPKSRTLMVPSGRSLMLAGFRSRWMTPISCAASSASAIWRASGSASSIGNRTFRDALGEVFALDELHDDRARACRFLDAVDLRDVRVVEGGEDLGLALEAGQAVAAARLGCAGVSRRWAGRTLMATSRLSLVSRAR